jgi:hypothetical protein
MKPLNAIFASAACLALGACAITISDEGVGRGNYDSDRDFISVKLPSGERGSIRCPEEMEVFVVNATAKGKGMMYGCRTRDAAVPTLD